MDFGGCFEGVCGTVGGGGFGLVFEDVLWVEYGGFWKVKVVG